MSEPRIIWQQDDERILHHPRHGYFFQERDIEREDWFTRERDINYMPTFIEQFDKMKAVVDAAQKIRDVHHSGKLIELGDVIKKLYEALDKLNIKKENK